MPIAFKSKLDSTVANSTFLDKTVDDKTVKILGLEDPTVAVSGVIIPDAQLQINRNTKTVSATVAEIDNSDQITLSVITTVQYLKIKGLSAATTINSLPFGTSVTPIDYSEIVLVGQDDTNTVTIDHNDNNFGCLLNGNATLLKGFMIALIYDEDLNRYIEKSRNF